MERNMSLTALVDAKCNLAVAYSEKAEENSGAHLAHLQSVGFLEDISNELAERLGLLLPSTAWLARINITTLEDPGGSADCLAVSVSAGEKLAGQFNAPMSEQAMR